MGMSWIMFLYICIVAMFANGYQETKDLAFTGNIQPSKDISNLKDVKLNETNLKLSDTELVEAESSWFFTRWFHHKPKKPKKRPLTMKERLKLAKHIAMVERS